MSMFPHKISIFNKVKNGNVSTYQKTIIKGVLVAKNFNSGRNKQDLTNSDNISIYIPQNADTQGKTYINEYEYVNSDKTLYFTFAKGDFIGVGDVDLGNSSINEYKNAHGNLYEITGFADYRFGGLPSLYVTCK